jgi:NADPH-dependent glutamate synthase beta subunit-like oxidoreductase
MDFLRPENLLRSGYKDCVLCEVERKGEEKRCARCSGLVDQRDRLLWEINRDRRRRIAGRLSLAWPGLGHFYAGRIVFGLFWASLLPVSVALVLSLWRGITPGHAFLLAEAGLIWYLAWLDARRGPLTPAAPCETACPAGIRVADYIALVREGRPAEALALVHDRLPFASFCGRACPHPCERECVRNEFGAPISIMAIKRYAADLGYASGVSPSSSVAGGISGPKVAIVGAGAAGLSAADTLARLGARVTVLDAKEEPGGTMRYGITEFRFPLEALHSDVKFVFARGIHFRGGVVFGKDETFATLAGEGFEAVLVAAGAWDPVRLPGAGSEAQGFHDALSFLTRVRMRRPPPLHGRVVVVGGGNVAIDVARTALRMGAADVTIACVESRESMPAFPREVEEALAEGAVLLPDTAVTRFALDGGMVTGFEALRVSRVEADDAGRVVPRTVPGSEFDVRADAVIMAAGSRAELSFLPAGTARKPVDGERHVFRLIFPGREPRITAYACGDCVRGPGTVVEASASGRVAALNIYRDLCVEEVRKARYRDNYRRRFEPQPTDRPEWRVRRGAARIPAGERRRTFEEVEKRFTDEDASHESERCARCNLWL